MLQTDKGAFLCDMAETYRIYDINKFPATQIAMYAAGLKDNSRIKIKMSGIELDYEHVILTAMFDKLNLLFWKDTVDGQANRNRPKSLLNNFIKEEPESAYSTFCSAEEFEEARQKIIERR